MSKNRSNVIIHRLNFQSELSRIIPRMAEKGITEWVTYHPRATYGYVDVIDHSGASPVLGRYVLTTEGVGSKTPKCRGTGRTESLNKNHRGSSLSK